MNIIKTKLETQVRDLQKAIKILRNINEDDDKFTLGIYLNLKPSQNIFNRLDGIAREALLYSDIAIVGDRVEKHRLGANGIIGERNLRCNGKNCGECRECIANMKARLAAYESRYGTLESTSAKEIAKEIVKSLCQTPVKLGNTKLDDAFTPLTDT